MGWLLDEAGNQLLDEALNPLLDEGISFPDTALGHTVELNLNGTWTDITSYVHDGQVSIARGHPDESVTVSPSTLSMTLTNSDGRFSTKNPAGPYYPSLVRNTPVRVSVPAQSNYLRLEADRASYASCPDAVALHVTGDIDIRVDVKLTDWQLSALAGKWNNGGGGQQCWLLALAASGSLEFFWSTTGSDVPFAVSTVPLPLAGRQCVRVTLAVATGTVTFYTGPAGGADGSTWTQLGAAVVTGATSIFAGTAAIAAGNEISGVNGINGNLYELEVRSGIAGTVKAHPVFSAQTAGVTSFSDAQSNTWTLHGTAEISSRNYRGHFELSELPQREPAYDPAGGTPDVTVAAVGGGLLRRQSQRSSPVGSAMYRAWTRAESSLVAAYWPMEDGANATSLGSASGGEPLYFSGSPKLASNSDFACSAPLPVTNGASFSGRLSYTGTWTDNQVVFLMEIPQAAEADNAVICVVQTTGTVMQMTLRYHTSGSGNLELFGYDSSGTQLFDSGLIAFAANGKQFLMAISLSNAGGGNVTWHVDGFVPGAASSTGLSGTISGTVGAVTKVLPNRDGTLTGTVLGHVAVLTSYQPLYTLFTYTNPYGLVTGALNAWAGEPAAIRFARLCAEEGIPCRIRGAANGTVLTGTQTQQTAAALLQECADADRGVWYECRQVLGWGYATRSALYGQAAQVTADHSQNHLALWASDPTEDDQVIVNDVTVTQTSGGSSSRKYASATQALTGGRLSTAAPPNGAGTYDQSYSINLYAAAALDSEASWILHIGTVDQPRFPGIVLDLTNRDLSSLFWNVLDMDLGDRLVISNPPAWLGPDPVSQLAQMLTEELGPFTLTVTVAGVPEYPYEVAVAGTAHADTAGTTLGAGVTSSATLLPFATAAGCALWTTSSADFPFDVMISGERCTVTDISGPPGNFLTGDAAGFEAGIANWNAAGNCTIARSTSQAHSGAASLALTSSGAGTMTAASCTAGSITSNGMACTAGDTIEASAWFRTAVSARSVAVGAQFYTSGGASISSLFGSTVTDAASGWVKATASLTAPATSAFARLLVEVVSAGGASEVHYVDDCALGDVTTGSALTQTATVTRSQNGVVKAQSSGAAVNVYPSPVAAL